MTFKVDDTVRCINLDSPHDAKDLTLNKVYTVVQVLPIVSPLVYVVNDRGARCGYLSSRFELVKREIELSRWYKPEEIHPREFDGHDVEVIVPDRDPYTCEPFSYNPALRSDIIAIRMIKKRKKKVKVEKTVYVIFTASNQAIAARETEGEAKNTLKWVVPGSYYVEMKGEIEIEVEED